MMADATTTFFEELGKRGHEPLVAKAHGSIRFELTDGRRTESWLVQLAGGDIKVSSNGGAADCVFRMSREIFDGLASGKLNPVVARLRDEIAVEGDLRLAVLFQRLLPGPPARRGRAAKGRKAQ
jgi:putative sterol carrier protein